MLVDKTKFDLLYGPPMLVNKTNLGLAIYNSAKFYRFMETSSKNIIFSLLFFGQPVTHLRHIIAQ